MKQNNLKYSLWEHMDTPLEVVYEFPNYIIETNGVTEFRKEYYEEMNEEDFMMLLLFNKFEKYSSYTCKDIINMNIKQEFYTMFTKEMLTYMLLTNDWRHDPH